MELSLVGFLYGDVVNLLYLLESVSISRKGIIQINMYIYIYICVCVCVCVCVCEWVISSKLRLLCACRNFFNMSWSKSYPKRLSARLTWLTMFTYRQLNVNLHLKTSSLFHGSSIIIDTRAFSLFPFLSLSAFDFPWFCRICLSIGAFFCHSPSIYLSIYLSIYSIELLFKILCPFRDIQNRRVVVSLLALLSVSRLENRLLYACVHGVFFPSL